MVTVSEHALPWHPQGNCGPIEKELEVHELEVEDSTALVILDAENFAGPPLAKVKLPQRVPFGAHGNWMPKA
jgi:hypothetical protein